jgi:hypothetical protein
MRTTVQFRERGFDDWKCEGPDVPNAYPPPGHETCERCGASVAAVSVARCGDHFSYWPSRKERR